MFTTYALAQFAKTLCDELDKPTTVEVSNVEAVDGRIRFEFRVKPYIHDRIVNSMYEKHRLVMVGYNPKPNIAGHPEIHALVFFDHLHPRK